MPFQWTTLEAKGVRTHPNPLKLPAGSLLVGQNIVIDREDVIELRRGSKLYGVLADIKKLFNYQNRILAHAGSAMYYDSDNAGTMTGLTGTFDAPTGANRIRSMEANKNFYFTSATGVKKMDVYNSTPGRAGMYKALGGTGATTGGSGYMANNTQVAYRIVWGITDANSNKIIGAPSQRIIVINNSGGTRDVALTFDIPSGITVNHIFQIYRSAQSTGVAVEPSDELQLIVERAPTAGEVAAFSASYTDATPDNLRGAALYTNPSQQGIAEANDEPPLAKDICVFKGSTIYANVISKHRMYITLIAAGGSGLVNDDTVAIAGTVYTGKATETPASGQFKVSTGGTAAQNIEDTAKSLVKVINQYATNTLVYAYYVSGYQDLPGQILIEERSIGGAVFYALSSRGSAFSPNLPASGTTYQSTNDIQQSYVAISKPGQPEAVPLKNYFPVGSGAAAILRIIALRDSAFILKEDGIYRITGESVDDFRIEEFDRTTILTCQESAVPLNNQVYAWTTQGIVAISEGGTRIMSRPIELTLLQISTGNYVNFDSASFGIGYESDRKYAFATVTGTADTYTKRVYVYNFLTETWTWWDFNLSCGLVSKRDNKLYLGDAALGYLRQERKDYRITDYADREIALNILSSSGTTIELADTTGLVAGWSVAQFSGTIVVRDSVIEEVVDGSHVRVADTLNWESGTATAYEPIEAIMTWAPLHGNMPAVMKHFQDQVAIFSNANFDSLEFSYTSNVSIVSEAVELIPKGGAPWGLFPWGEAEWGGGTPQLQPIRTLVPKEKARCHWLNLSATHNQALTTFALSGLTLFFEATSSRSK